uniref:Uncharacterized protein n=1 Tax=Romanomermis culicivorax TaxID=13658 RepID=A0A915IB12_ROMCU
MAMMIPATPMTTTMTAIAKKPMTAATIAINPGPCPTPVTIAAIDTKLLYISTTTPAAYAKTTQ